MRKPINILSSIAIAAAFLTAAPASAQQYETYLTIYYSDATHQTEVGRRYWTGCNRYGYPTYRLEGTATVYYEEELAGYCGGPE